MTLYENIFEFSHLDLLLNYLPLKLLTVIWKVPSEILLNKNLCLKRYGPLYHHIWLGRAWADLEKTRPAHLYVNRKNELGE